MQLFFLDGNFQALQIDSAVTKSLDLEDVDRYIFLLFQLTWKQVGVVIFETTERKYVKCIILDYIMLVNVNLNNLNDAK